MHRRNIYFWGLFLLLNLFLQLPQFLFNIPINRFAPRWVILLQLSTEWVWLVAFWVWFRPIRHPITRRILTTFYLFSLVFHLYDYGILAVYTEPPNLYNDITLLLSGGLQLVRNLGLPYLIYGVAIFGAVLVGILCSRLIHQMLATINDNRTQHVAIPMLILFGSTLPLMWAFVVKIPRPVYLSQTATTKLTRNLARSFASRQQGRLFQQIGPQLESAYDYSGYRWREKPDVHIIAIESYGDALLQWDEFRPKYTTLLTELEQALAQTDWHSATARSAAPIQGGKSWLSITSLMFGLRISEDSQYGALRDYFQSVDYPHLGNTFREQGYTSWRLFPIQVEPSDQALLDATQRLNNFDRLLTLDDLEPFAGPRYGWGPTPPDQYSLWFLREQANRSETNQPNLFFMLTHNSHRPWGIQPPLVENWRELANPVANTPIQEHEPYSKTRYWQAIEYQLQTVTDFIVRGPKDAIYVIVGDHQPPLIAFDDYEGSATPLHIIAKNETLVSQFIDQGYAKGLTPTVEQPTFTHEGFYSLFMHNWLATFAENPNPLPPLCPNGLIFAPQPNPCALTK